jgi:hypothetical protein
MFDGTFHYYHLLNQMVMQFTYCTYWGENVCSACLSQRISKFSSSHHQHKYIHCECTVSPVVVCNIFYCNVFNFVCNTKWDTLLLWVCDYVV